MPAGTGSKVTLETLAAQLQEMRAETRGLRREVEEFRAEARALGGSDRASLAYLARQQQQLLKEQAEMRTELRVVSQGLSRLDGTVQGLVGEVRANRERVDLHDAYWRDLETRTSRLEPLAPGLTRPAPKGC
jgi:prefoldin subunit 5